MAGSAKLALREEIAHLLRLSHFKITDYDAILRSVGDSNIVLIGEASHGTHDYYYHRAEITKRLIQEKGFNAIALEADWPDAYRINKYVRGFGTDNEAVEALGDFKRFPRWMWRNTVMVDFVGWLREHNDSLKTDSQGNIKDKVGIYGLDLYSLHGSMQLVLEFLEKTDPKAAERARRRYACFDLYGPDSQAYGLAAHETPELSCESAAIAQLIELTHKHAHKSMEMSGNILLEDEEFCARQNAAVVKGAENYYRIMFSSRTESWNVRDTHMADTLEELLRHLHAVTGKAKVVVWAHNSHIGDARATERAAGGKLNVGQLCRERFGIGTVYNIGFTGYTGKVTAASDWGKPARHQDVVPGMKNSYELLFHDSGLANFGVIFRSQQQGDINKELVESLAQKAFLERAIGVVYRPLTERASHYLKAYIARQFDAVIHIDVGRALEPIDRTPQWKKEHSGDVGETFPTGL